MCMVPGAQCPVLNSTVRSGRENLGQEEEEEREGEGEGRGKFGRGKQLGQGALGQEGQGRRGHR